MMTFETIRNIIAKRTESALAEIRMDADLRNDLALDSLDLTELFILLDMNMADNVYDFHTVADIGGYVGTK